MWCSCGQRPASLRRSMLKSWRTPVRPPLKRRSTLQRETKRGIPQAMTAPQVPPISRSPGLKNAPGESEQVRVDGSTTIQLEPGTYTVVEERTQAKYELEVVPAQNVVLTVSQPARGGPGTTDDRQAPRRDQSVPTSRSSSDNGSANTSTGLLVTRLPNVGAGNADGSMNAATGLTIASVLSGASGLMLRQRR